MSQVIEFDKTHSYSLYDVGITVSVNLFHAEKEVEFDAKIDTGSTFCIFQRLHGELLNLQIEIGIPAEIGTVTGSFRAFGHEVEIEVLGIKFVSTVYFAESEYFDRDVLGRVGWLNKLNDSALEVQRF